MRLLLLSIEFNAGTFSGNGVYACSQARALTQLGHEVLVIAGAPASGAAESGDAAAAAAALAQSILHVPLPVWGRLDAGCGWREFAVGAGSAEVAAAAAAFRPHAVLGVDWHSVAAYERLAPGLPGSPPFLFLNYRVYHRTASAEELAVIEGQEREALRLSACSLVLSRSDAAYLCTHFPEVACDDRGAAPLHVLLPALRSDMQALPPPAQGAHEEGSAFSGAARAAAAAGPAEAAAEQGTGGAAAGAAATAAAAQRHYLTCCVRLSPEKEAHRFVDLICELQARGALARLGVTPLMAGAGGDTPYGREQRARVEAAVPQCIIHESFLGPAQLAQVYAATLLNLHPPTYDAYGMTIVEAASQGAPSLVQGGGHVGATDLLSPEAGEVVVCEMDAPIGELADRVEALLSDRAALRAVGRAAQAKARSWTEHDNAAALVGYVQAALAAGRAAAVADKLQAA